MRPGRWVERGRRRSRAWSQQAGFGGLPQAHEPVEPTHQHVDLLRTRRRFGGGLELLALGTELAEAVHEWRLRTAWRVGVAHCEFELYQETGSEERLPGVRGAPSLRSPWSNLRSSSACVRSTGGQKGGPRRSPWRSASGSCSAPT